MKNIIITSTSNTILYKTKAESMAEALEKAVTDNIKLHNADLSHLDLRNINIDECDLTGSDFRYSNLGGANLSESNLSGCNFDDASLVNACLAYTNLTNSLFHHTEFGATDITQADLSHCKFSGTSCFSLNFIQCKSMQGATYKHIKKENYLNMSNPPIVIQGLETHPIIINDNYILCGSSIRDNNSRKLELFA